MIRIARRVCSKTPPTLTSTIDPSSMSNQEKKEVRTNRTIPRKSLPSLQKGHPSVALTNSNKAYCFYHPKSKGIPYDLTKELPDELHHALTSNQRLRSELNSRGKDLDKSLPLGPNQTYMGPETQKDGQMWWNSDHKAAALHLSDIFKMDEKAFTQDSRQKRFDFESDRKIYVPRRHSVGDSEGLVPEDE